MVVYIGRSVNEEITIIFGNHGRARENEMNRPVSLLRCVTSLNGICEREPRFRENLPKSTSITAKSQSQSHKTLEHST